MLGATERRLSTSATRSRRMAVVVAVTVAGAIASSPPAAAAPPLASLARHCSGSHQLPSAGGTMRARRAVLCLVNRFRRVHGRSPLRGSGALTIAAQSYSREMATDHFFSHVAPNGGTMVERLRRSGYIRPGEGWTVGENLAWGEPNLATPAAIVAAWARSPGHRANMLMTGYREAGIGVALATPAGQTGATYALEFGVRD